MVDDSLQLYNDVQHGLRKQDSRNRLKTVQLIREIKPIDLWVYESMLEFLKDPSLELRRAVVDVIEDLKITGESIYKTLSYHVQNREKNTEIKSAIYKILHQRDKESEKIEQELGEKISKAVSKFDSVDVEDEYELSTAKNQLRRMIALSPFQSYKDFMLFIEYYNNKYRKNISIRRYTRLMISQIYFPRNSNSLNK